VGKKVFLCLKIRKRKDHSIYHWNSWESHNRTNCFWVANC